MLERDVNNLATYFGQFAPELNGTKFCKEIWKLFTAGLLTPETALTGIVAQDTRPVDLGAVMEEIESAIFEEKERQRLREIERQKRDLEKYRRQGEY